MADQYRDVATRSWGKRITQSLGNAVVGFVLFLGAIGVLWWNEGRSVDRIATLETGRDLVVSVGGVEPTNGGKLVHIMGFAETDQTLKDPIFQIEETAIRLERTVQMYQWQETQQTETEKDLGGSERVVTTYSYATVWNEGVIDSSKFKLASEHQNPNSIPFVSAVFQAKDVTVGDFHLTEPFIAQIDSAAVLELTEAMQAHLPDEISETYRIQSNEFVRGDLANPQIGDIKVGFSWVAETDVSAIGRQTGDRLTAFPTKTGSLELLETGSKDPEAMFQTAEDENTLITWFIRIVGVLCIGIGFSMILAPLARLGDAVPIIGSIIGAGIGLIATVVAVSIGFTVIAVAWLSHRPLIGAIMLAVAVGAVAGGVWLARKRKAIAPA